MRIVWHSLPMTGVPPTGIVVVVPDSTCGSEAQSGQAYTEDRALDMAVRVTKGTPCVRVRITSMIWKTSPKPTNSDRSPSGVSKRPTPVLERGKLTS